MTRRTIVVLAVGSIGLASVSAQQPQQQQPLTFRTGVRTVPVYVTVSDGAGGFALDLTKDDFEVRDNGRVQTVTQFTTAAQPLSTLLLLDGSSVLGFTPAVLDGNVHRLEVKVKQPNTRVRARRSYVASEKPEGGGRP